jgi:hypothetical protein
MERNLKMAPRIPNEGNLHHFGAPSCAEREEHNGVHKGIERSRGLGSKTIAGRISQEMPDGNNSMQLAIDNCTLDACPAPPLSANVFDLLPTPGMRIGGLSAY